MMIVSGLSKGLEDLKVSRELPVFAWGSWPTQYEMKLNQ